MARAVFVELWQAQHHATHDANLVVVDVVLNVRSCAVPLPVDLAYGRSIVTAKRRQVALPVISTAASIYHP